MVSTTEIHKKNKSIFSAFRRYCHGTTLDCSTWSCRWKALSTVFFYHVWRLTSCFHGRAADGSLSIKQELESQYSPSRWSHRMSADDVIKAHVKALKEGRFIFSQDANLVENTNTFVAYSQASRAAELNVLVSLISPSPCRIFMVKFGK